MVRKAFFFSKSGPPTREVAHTRSKQIQKFVIIFNLYNFICKNDELKKVAKHIYQLKQQ